MTGEERDRRDSRALEPELITDTQAKAVAEARNGFRQYDAAMGTVHTALDRGSFKLRPSLITPIHLASYLMWRLNWIHPFADGNGRTSRIVSYVVLSIRAGSVLPGTPTIPDQIVDNRKPYLMLLMPQIWHFVMAASMFRRWKNCWALCSQTSLHSFTSLSAASCLAS